MTAQMLCYIAVMAGTTYLIRALPMLLVRRKIKSHFVQSFLYYVPYAVLAAMTVPAILESTASAVSAMAGLAVAVLYLIWAPGCCLWRWRPVGRCSAPNGCWAYGGKSRFLKAMRPGRAKAACSAGQNRRESCHSAFPPVFYSWIS